MRRFILSSLILLPLAGLLLGQGPVTSGPGRPYDVRTPPPIPLSSAYAMALSRIGPATNRFYCVSASCVETTLPSYAGWVFWFSNTNREQARVEVYFESKAVHIPDARSAELLK